MVPSPPSMSAGVAERKLTTHPYTTRRILRVAATRLSKPGRPNLTPTFFSEEEEEEEEEEEKMRWMRRRRRRMQGFRGIPVAGGVPTTLALKYGNRAAGSAYRRLDKRCDARSNGPPTDRTPRYANDGCSTNIYLRVTRLYTLACSMPLLREEIDAHLPRWQRQRWVKMAAVAAPAASAATAEAEADHSRRHSILLGRDFDSRRLGGW
ncbi:hypothetical protein V1477_001274 [Vespula maculifrons]|uniref:Uncharacterized protein n=1 Tax=Vespula maculifrons TaxID=7453 RepID=A0ABD2D0I7_VESMC